VADLQAVSNTFNTAIGDLQTATGTLSGAVADLQAVSNAFTTAIGDLQSATNALNATLELGADASTDFMKADGSTGLLNFASGIITNTP
jgi:hypothetical protein